MSDAVNPVVNGAGVMRVLGAQRPLVLAAHDAARAMRRRTLKSMLKRLLRQRMLLSRTSACRRPAWTPLLLRWARKAVAVRSSGAVRAPALPASPASQFHWHLHLTALLGSERERREARTTAVTDPFRTRAPASRMNPPSAGRMAGTGYRRLRDPAGTIEGACAIPAYPQPASIGPVRFAERAEAWKASPALAAKRASYKCRWPERAAPHARWLRGQADSRPGERPHAPAAQSFLTRGHLPPGAQPFDQARGAGRNAAADPLLTSTSMARRSPMEAPAKTTSTKRSIYAQVQAGSEGLLRQTRSQVTRTLLRSKRGQPATHAFASSRPPAAGRRLSEQTWRARNPAATAARFTRRHTAAPPTASSIAMRRPADLVWLAGPTSFAPPGDTPRSRTGSGALASSAQSKAAAQVPTASSGTGDNTVVRAAALDPVLANRLADEVIRRIDYRARIERERRGL